MSEKELNFENLTEEERENLRNQAFKDLENWYDNAIAGKGLKTEEERKAYIESLGDMEKHPMFATNMEDLKQHPLTEAIRLIKEEKKSNYELAVLYKDEGNDILKKKIENHNNEAIARYQHAMTFLIKEKKYREKIRKRENNNLEKSVENLTISSDSNTLKEEDNDEDDNEYKTKETDEEINILHSQLFSNIAFCELNKNNYIGCKKASILALNLWPANLKAHLRKAKALFLLKDYKPCLKAIEEGLKYDKNNEELNNYYTKINEIIKKNEESRNTAYNNLYLTNKKNSKLTYDIFKSLKIKLGCFSPTNIEPQQLRNQWATYNNILTNEILLPCLFLYPEYNKFDIIPDCNIDVMLVEFLLMMFPEEAEENYVPPDWDINKKYKASNLVVYLEINNETEEIKSYDEFLVNTLEYQVLVNNSSSDYFNYGLENVFSSIQQTNLLGYEKNKTYDYESIQTISRERENNIKLLNSKKTKLYYNIHIGCTLRKILSIVNILPRGILNLIIFPKGNNQHHNNFLTSIKKEGHTMKTLNP